MVQNLDTNIASVSLLLHSESSDSYSTPGRNSLAVVRTCPSPDPLLSLISKEGIWPEMKKVAMPSDLPLPQSGLRMYMLQGRESAVVFCVLQWG